MTQKKYVFEESVPVRDPKNWATHIFVTVQYTKGEGFFAYCSPTRIEDGLRCHEVFATKWHPLTKCRRVSQKRFDEALETYKSLRDKLLATVAEQLGYELEVK